jgi:hypothetical protein
MAGILARVGLIDRGVSDRRAKNHSIELVFIGRRLVS